jgi:hypothetical protein
VQIGDGRERQPQCVGGKRLFRRSRQYIALRGEKGRDIGRSGGEGGEIKRFALGSPSAHAGAVGAAGVVRLGMAREGLGGALGGCQRAVGRRDCRLGDSVEPPPMPSVACRTAIGG